MSLNLAGFVKSLLPSFDKSNIESDMEISLDAIPTVLEAYAKLSDIEKGAGFSNKLNKEKIKQFFQELKDAGHKVKLTHRFMATDMVTLFTNVKVNGDYILKEIDDAVNDVVVSQALTAYKANLLRAVDHYYFIVRYALDFANYLYINESVEAGLDLADSSKMNKQQRAFIEKHFWIFVRMISVYGDEHNAFKTKVEKLEPISLPKESIDEAVAAYDNDKVDMFSNLPQGFIGSPIYSVRLVFAQWEADRYRGLKDKKKLLELRYLHLKLMQEQGQHDVTVEKEINYLQKSITDLDYKLSKIESDL